ncbi:hypothetical protein IKG10_03210 [Candidatus Saccharibacteria bacterium]|nr:hypothetical protein [Candidatus Saccharibacteria bacterium]
MSFEIISGPTLEILLDSFKHAYDDDTGEPVEVKFGVVSGVVFDRNNNEVGVLVPMSDVKILGIRYEDDSGTNFSLLGRCFVNLNPHSARKSDKIRRFRAYYSTDTGLGKIVFL